MSEYRTVLGTLQGSQEGFEASRHESAIAPWRRRTRCPLGGAIKRAMDVALALMTIVLLAPTLLIVAATLRVVVGRPIISEQKLVGFGGEVFIAYQFRAISEDEGLAACLRGRGIDKLPRLFNILRGDMSFVGPQPLTSEECRRTPPHAEYLIARPGLISLRHTRGAEDPGGFRRAAFDRYYVRRWSVGLDLLLLMKSVAAPREKEV